MIEHGRCSTVLQCRHEGGEGLNCWQLCCNRTHPVRSCAVATDELGRTSCPYTCPRRGVSCGLLGCHYQPSAAIYACVHEMDHFCIPTPSTTKGCQVLPRTKVHGAPTMHTDALLPSWLSHAVLLPYSRERSAIVVPVRISSSQNRMAVVAVLLRWT